LGLFAVVFWVVRKPGEPDGSSKEEDL